MLDYIGQAVMVVNKNRKICFWNKAAEKLYGWSRQEALGHDVVEILGRDQTSPMGESDIIMKRLMAGESWSDEVTVKREDGSLVPVILNRAPIFNDEGVYVCAVTIATDIAEQKQTERDLALALESLSYNLDRIEEMNEKLRVVGSLTRHDVRNKLCMIPTYAYLIKKKHTDQPDVADGLGKMEQAVREVEKIFDFARTYEQLGVEESFKVDVEKAANEAAGMFSGLPFKVVNDCHGLTVQADSFIRQLIYNLIDNTRKYGKTATTARMHYKRTDQGNLQLIYEDDGVGIPLENKQKLFKQGFSTGASTGFGLFLTKKMTDVYGWTMEETGEPGKGAKFIITIAKTNKNGQDNYQIQQQTELVDN